MGGPTDQQLAEEAKGQAERDEAREIDAAEQAAQSAQAEAESESQSEEE